jgi:hypothetical protein
METLKFIVWVAHLFAWWQVGRYLALLYILIRDGEDKD